MGGHAVGYVASIALAWSVAVSVLAGLVEGHVLDVERTMSLLPFFVLGLEATPAAWRRCANPSYGRLPRKRC